VWGFVQPILPLHLTLNPPEPAPQSPAQGPATTEPGPPAPSLYLDGLGPRLKEHRPKPLRIVGRWRSMARFEPQLPALEERS